MIFIDPLSIFFAIVVDEILVNFFVLIVNDFERCRHTGSISSPDKQIIGSLIPSITVNAIFNDALFVDRSNISDYGLHIITINPQLYYITECESKTTVVLRHSILL